MSTALPGTYTLRRGDLARITPWLLAAAGWGAMLALPPTLTLPAFCSPAFWTEDGAVGDPLALWRNPGAWRELWLINRPTLAAAAWALMLLAMMPPLLHAPALALWRASLPRRRLRTLLLAACTYVALWMAAGALLLVAAMALRVLASAVTASPWLPSLLGLALALSWDASPAGQRWRNRCHARPRLQAFGWAADRDSLQFGLQHGARCIAACWAWMLLPLTAASGHLPLMLLAAVVMQQGRSRCGDLPRWRWPLRRSWRSRSVG